MEEASHRRKEEERWRERMAIIKKRKREHKRRREREKTREGEGERGGGGEASSHLRVYCWSGQLKKKTIFVKIESDSCHHHKPCAETFSSDGNKSLIIRRERERERERESLCLFERES